MEKVFARRYFLNVCLLLLLCMISFLIFQYANEKGTQQSAANHQTDSRSGESDSLEPQYSEPVIYSRTEFFSTITTIKIGMPQSLVMDVLGKPSEIWTRKKTPHKMTSPNTNEVWAYGVTQAFGFATLGRVEFDNLGQVCDVIGEIGQPIESSLISELQLRRLIQLLDDLPKARGYGFDCYRLVATANEFQPIGQETTFSLIREYERVSEHNANFEGIYLLLYLLHDIPDSGILPELPLGLCIDKYPGVEKDFPRFPIHLLGGVPILLTPGYTFAGARPPIEELLQQIKKSAQWIMSPIQLDDRSLNELTIDLERLVVTKKLFFEHQSRVKLAMIRTQLEMYVERRDRSSTPVINDE